MTAALIHFGKDGQRKNIELKSGIVIVGRRPDCDIRIPLSIVSRKHCRIVYNDNELTLQDLGSANGTFLNNQLVTKMPLSAGDLLTIGPIKFIVQIDGKPQNLMPPTAGKAKLPSDSSLSDILGLGPGDSDMDGDVLSDMEPQPGGDFEDDGPQ